MGWKRVKEHYRIGHIVQISEGNLLIGSPYISDIIVLAPDGAFLKEYGGLDGDLARYQDEIKADPATFLRLLGEPDRFEKSIPVYTYEGADIIEKCCDEAGWPNVTHDGQLMYENTFSTDRAAIVSAARHDAKAWVKHYRTKIVETEASLQGFRNALAEREAAVARLSTAEASPV